MLTLGLHSRRFVQAYCRVMQVLPCALMLLLVSHQAYPLLSQVRSRVCSQLIALPANLHHSPHHSLLLSRALSLVHLHLDNQVLVQVQNRQRSRRQRRPVSQVGHLQHNLARGLPHSLLVHPLMSLRVSQRRSLRISQARCHQVSRQASLRPGRQERPHHSLLVSQVCSRVCSLLISLLDSPRAFPAHNPRAFQVHNQALYHRVSLHHSPHHTRAPSQVVIRAVNLLRGQVGSPLVIPLVNLLHNQQVNLVRSRRPTPLHSRLQCLVLSLHAAPRAIRVDNHQHSLLSPQDSHLGSQQVSRQRNRVYTSIQPHVHPLRVLQLLQHYL